jgi:hypothetical protein
MTSRITKLCCRNTKACPKNSANSEATRSGTSPASKKAKISHTIAAEGRQVMAELRKCMRRIESSIATISDEAKASSEVERRSRDHRNFRTSEMAQETLCCTHVMTRVASDGRIFSARLRRRTLRFKSMKRAVQYALRMSRPHPDEAFIGTAFERSVNRYEEILKKILFFGTAVPVASHPRAARVPVRSQWNASAAKGPQKSCCLLRLAAWGHAPT